MRPLTSSLALAALLVGCIPPSPSYPSRDAPHIEPEMGVLFDEIPVWDARPATATASAVEAGVYVVQPGDTLSAIGERTQAGMKAIADANGLVPPFSIRAGQKLNIPAGRFHRVTAGETGIAIARAYAVPWSSIVAANKLSEPFALQVGQRLEIPNLARTAEQSLEARAAAFKLDIDDILTGGEPALTDSRLATSGAERPKSPLPPQIAVVEPGSFSGQFGWPAAGRVIARFGPVGEGQVNEGIEIATGPAAPIRASAEGVVAFVGNNVAGYGGMILIRHGAGWISAYGRAARTTVTRGQSVKRGDIIGVTGASEAPQLHFQLRKNRMPIDPLTQLQGAT